MRFSVNKPVFFSFITYPWFYISFIDLLELLHSFYLSFRVSDPNVLFKGLRKKVCEVYPFFKNSPKIMVIIAKKHLCSSLWKGLFLQRERIQSPYTYRLNVRVLVQLERITFRAVLIHLRTALFICSESDTFLMNFNIFIVYIVAKYEVFRFHSKINVLYFYS